MESSFLSAEPAPVESLEVMRAKIQRMEDASRVRRIHGQHITDELVDQFLADEVDLAERKAKRAEQESLLRIAEAERLAELKKCAFEMTESDRILITVRGTRVKMDKDFCVPCPKCGTGISIEGWVMNFARMWHDAPKPNRFSGNSQLIVYNARGPFSSPCGAPMYLVNPPCHGCEETPPVMILLVVI